MMTRFGRGILSPIVRGSIFFLIAATLAAKSYAVDGIVVALDPVARTILVSHRPIAGYMPAMTMPFRVEDSAELNGLYRGARVQFQLEIAKDHSLARRVRKVEGADVEIPPPPQTLPIGHELPPFRLTDQHGRTLDSSELRGKVVAISFLYTRCPLPDVCPRLAASFAAIARRFHDRPDLVLLSVTVDPDYDTPAVLEDYAARWNAGPNWRFLTGDVARLAAQMGEVYWSDEGSIGHNSTTTIVGRDGRIAARVDGSSWRVDQLENLIARELEGTR
jgi:protein SCO1